MGVYEIMKREIARRQQKGALEISVGERMGSAFMAGCVCWAFIFPADTIRSKIYAYHVQNPGCAETPGTIEMGRRILKERGIIGFYKGVGLTVVRAGPVAATVLPIYDVVLEHLVVEDV